ncbi:glycoside hydrolase family 18 protein, partial [Chitinolyticbacter albus]|uniref:glycoside hydrolase family 18 protein n=1 Tax=Chitinolyticbacter albus TaxID=2961951 RepID=UPI00210CD911
RTPSRRVDPADTIKWDDKMAGNFRELKALKAKYPKIKNMISLGGWTWSKWFSNAAATDALRKQLVKSCIDIYIKGNLPVVDGRGGPGAAADVFDGIDIDWEFPSVQGFGYNTVAANDGENYRLLLAEFRKQLDELGATTGKRYALTIALGMGKDKLDKINVGSYAPYLDWINMMTYDYNGGWDLTQTNFQSHLYRDPAAPNDKCSGKAGDTCYGDRSLVSFYNTDDALNQLLSQGAPANKLVLGLPFYGRGWT